MKGFETPIPEDTVPAPRAAEEPCPAMKGFETLVEQRGGEECVETEEPCPAMKGFETCGKTAHQNTARQA